VGKYYWGNQKASGLFDTQKQAIDAAKARAKRDGLGKDGKFREKNSYGNDPRKIKGLANVTGKEGQN